MLMQPRAAAVFWYSAGNHVDLHRVYLYLKCLPPLVLLPLLPLPLRFSTAQMLAMRMLHPHDCAGDGPSAPQLLRVTQRPPSWPPLL